VIVVQRQFSNFSAI